MAVILDKSRPICPQIEEILSIRIARKEYIPGQKLPSVRDIAVEASVNPNTVQKAFEGLSQKGVLNAIRGSGWYVSDDITIAEKIVNKLVTDKTNDYISDMNNLGFDKQKIIKIIEECNL